MRLFQLLLVVLVLSACGLVIHKGVQVFLRPAEVRVEATPDPEGETDHEPRAVVARPMPEADQAADAVAENAPAAAPEGASRSISDKNRRAIELLEKGDLEGAIELFEECHAAEPEQPVFARNLAEALARHAAKLHEEATRESMAAALEELERAIALDANREELVRLLGRWRRSAEAEEEFGSYGSNLFELVYDGFRPDLSHGIPALLEKLEKTYHEFGDLFGFYPVEAGRTRIRVVFYRREEFDAVTGLGHWAGGVFDGTVRVPVEDLEREGRRIDVVLRHELLHAFVQEAGGKSVPGWLNEGLAQYLEARTVGQRLADVQVARKKLENRDLFPIERLQGSLATWKDPAEIRLAYAQSLALVAYIAGQYGDRVVYGMVSGCREGKTPDVTFRNRIGVELAVVIEDLDGEL